MEDNNYYTVNQGKESRCLTLMYRTVSTIYLARMGWAENNGSSLQLFLPIVFTLRALLQYERAILYYRDGIVEDNVIVDQSHADIKTILIKRVAILCSICLLSPGTSSLVRFFCSVRLTPRLKLASRWCGAMFTVYS